MRGRRWLLALAALTGAATAHAAAAQEATRFEVRNAYVGKDNIPRLNLKFLDHQTPDRLFKIG